MDICRKCMVSAGILLILLWYVFTTGIFAPEPPQQRISQNISDEAVFDTGNISVWGAMYFPTDAYNTWQMWADYNRTQIERDMSYAASVNLNAVRVFASYEYWQKHPEQFKERFDHFLSATDRHDIRVLPVLFESIGSYPTPTTLRDTNIQTSFAVHSPSQQRWIAKIWLGDEKWNDGPQSPEAFTRWFSKTYGDDDRVLAIEIMNEPGDIQPRHDFVEDMLKTAKQAAPEAKLTVGSKALHYNKNYETELDIYQFHLNLPPTKERVKEVLAQAKQFSEAHDNKPVWLTEWQRLRHVRPPQEDFPETHPDYPQKMLPDYESMAPLLQHTDAIDGAFLWGLMLKPAYICNPRVKGRINGIFHPDGAVYDLDDAQAVAQNKSFTAPERTQLPDGMPYFLEKQPLLYCSTH